MTSSGVSTSPSSRVRRSRSARSPTGRSRPRRSAAAEHVGLPRGAGRAARTGGGPPGGGRRSSRLRAASPGHGIASPVPWSKPRRNVELKASDPDPGRTVRRALAHGAEDRGEIVQRDTYFRGGRGAAEAARGEARRGPPDRVRAPGRTRVACSRIGPRRPPRARSPPHGQRSGSAWWSRSPAPAAVGDVRIHVDDVTGLGSFVELEAVGSPGSDLGPRARAGDELRADLASGMRPCGRARYADPVGPPAPRPTPSCCASPARPPGRAYAPYSNFPVGAAVRTTTAAATRAPTSRTPPTRRVSARRRRRSARWWPAGAGGSWRSSSPRRGGRVRAVRRLPPAAARVRRPRHAGPPRRPRARAPHHVLGELLPLSFGPESLG